MKLLERLKLFPIETYVILIPGMLFFAVIEITDLFLHRWGMQFDPRLLLMGPMVGGGTMRDSSVALILYGLFRIGRYFQLKDEQGRSGIDRATHDPNFFVVALSSTYWFFVSTALVLGSAAIFHVLFRAFSYTEMAAASDLLLSWDRLLFGVFPPLYIHSLGLPHIAHYMLACSYAILPPLMAVFFVWLFLNNKKIFRVCFISLMLATYISLPFWIMFPAIPPNEAYRLNVFHQEFSPALQAELKVISFNPYAEYMLAQIEKMWFDPEGRSFSVSSFPSTHVIWATIVLYAAFRISRWVGVLMVPYYVINFIATMFLLEHYAVDTMLGVLLGILIIIIAHALLQYEEMHMEDRYKLLEIFPVIKFQFAQFAFLIPRRMRRSNPPTITQL